jgi:hypothetical protein
MYENIKVMYKKGLKLKFYVFNQLFLILTFNLTTVYPLSPSRMFSSKGPLRMGYIRHSNSNITWMN